MLDYGLYFSWSAIKTFAVEAKLECLYLGWQVIKIDAFEAKLEWVNHFLVYFESPIKPQIVCL